MILHPSVLAQLVAAALVAGLLAYAARWGVAILRRWDLSSGSAGQLALERRTVLVSTAVRVALLFQLGSLFLFVHTADALAPLFTGAMCAAGTLKASGFGYPALLVKLVTFVLAGLWLALDRLDASAPDHPLVRPKYAFLVALAPLLAVDAALTAAYFLDLRPEVITSCCGSLFGRSGRGVAGGLASLPPGPTGVAYFAVLALAVASGLALRVTGRGGAILAVASAAAVPLALAAVIAVVSPYAYALPSHHCPFCLLQREYRYVGYALYAAILAGGVAGMAAGIAGAARRIPSLAAVAPAFQRRLGAAAALSFGALGLASAAVIAASELRM